MSKISELEQEVNSLRAQLRKKEEKLRELKQKERNERRRFDKLSNEEIARYSRQIILPEIGVKGQIAIRKASILIVGAGGLGRFNWEFCFQFSFQMPLIKSFQVVHQLCICAALALVELE